MNIKNIAILALNFTLPCWVMTVSAQSFYPVIDTNSYPAGAYASIVVGNVANEITATFTSSGGDNLRLIYMSPGQFENINGAAIFNQTAGDNLVVQFSSVISSFQINWAADTIDGSSVMDMSGYLDGNLVGSSASTASDPLEYDEGAALYSDAGGFDKLIIGLDPTVGAGATTGLWAIGTDVAGTGNFGNDTVPEPSTMVLAGLCGAGFLFYRRRK